MPLLTLKYIEKSAFFLPLLSLSRACMVCWIMGCFTSDGVIPPSTSDTSTPILNSQSALEFPLSGIGDGSFSESSSTLTLTSISPTQGGSDTLITLIGSHFSSDSTITVGDLPCNGTTIVSSFAAFCRTPSNSLGLKSVQITQADGTFAILDSALLRGYTYNPSPSLISVSPSLGGSGNSLTITGTEFLAGASVLLGGVDCPVTVTTPTTLTCTVPIHQPGTVDIQVTNGDGQSISMADVFTYLVQGTQIVTGLEHTCSLVNGGVRCWGNNTFGQLGDSTTLSSSIPVQVTGLSSGVQSITAGDFHTCAIVNGAAKCWGHNFYGQLGDNSNTQTTNPNSVPLSVTNLSSNVLSISAGAFHTCANVASKGVQCWGNNLYGQLGTTTHSGTTSTNYTPTTVSPMDSTEDGLVLPSGDFELDSDSTAWTAVSGTFTSTPRTATPASSTSPASGNAMLWEYSNSNTSTGNVRKYTFSTARDFTTHRYVRIQFRNDSLTSATYNRTISIILTSGTATNTYTLTGLAGGASFPVNTWIDFKKLLSSPNSSSGSGFSFSAVNSISLLLKDDSAWNITPSGSVYWDHLQLVDSVSVQKLAAGGYHTCVIRNGKVLCWGLNYNGQLGKATNVGTLTANPAPLAVTQTMTTDVSQITGGRYNTCGIKNGAAWCWGLNDYGQLGDGTTMDQTDPVAVASASTGVQEISAGHHHTCLIQDGATYCLGRNNGGQLGDSSTTDRTVLTSAAGFISGSQGISAAVNHSCSIRNGLAYCWGLNGNGEIGDNTIILRDLPTAVYGLGWGTGIQGLGSGYGQSCALVNGGVECWGWNGYGQLGMNTTTDSSTPTSVILQTGTPYAQAVVGGGTHTCAIQNGAAYCWGKNSSAQLGDGTSVNRLLPTAVSSLTSGVESLGLGSDFTCGVQDGAGFCWGSNSNGQLGDATTLQKNTPTSIVDSTTGEAFSSGVTAIGTGSTHACALKNGAVFCWGDNTYGQLGSNSADSSSTIPVPVAESAVGESFLSGVSEIALGAFHSCAVKNYGVWCWGQNNYGQLGNSSTASSLIPVQVSSISAVQSLTAGYYHTCAVANGDVKCWGYNAYGELGNNSLTFSPTPVKMFGSSGSQSVSAGAFSTCILLNGTVQCVGYNFFGQLGNGSTTHLKLLGNVAGF